MITVFMRLYFTIVGCNGTGGGRVKMGSGGGEDRRNQYFFLLKS